MPAALCGGGPGKEPSDPEADQLRNVGAVQRNTVLAVLIVVAVMCTGLAWRSMTPAGGPTAANRHLAMPVLSPRRTSEFLAAADADANTRTQVRRAIAGGHLGPGNKQVCVVADQAGRPVVNVASDQALTPASALKLLTASAALDILGNNAHFTTQVTTQATTEVTSLDTSHDTGHDKVQGVRSATLEGSLNLVGGGDPLLFTADYAASFKDRPDIHTPLEALADAVVKSGIRTVSGGVVGDDGRFDKQRSIPTWDPGYLSEGQVGPIGALQVNQGFSRFVGGRTPSSDPALQAATVFTDLLRARGITVERAPSSEAVQPKGQDTVASVDSPPLTAIIGEMLSESDNSVAEVILKDLAFKAVGQGTTADGIVAVTDDLTRRNVPLAGLVMRDGSGLDRGDRVTCLTLQSVLEAGGAEGVIANSLPRAGETGTLLTRMDNTPAVGHLKAKTGTLEGVNALAGWAYPTGLPPMAFTIINNVSSQQDSRSFEDGLGVYFASLVPPAPLPALNR